MKLVKDLPQGPFHLAVIIVGKTAVPIFEGEVIINGEQKELCNLENGAIYDEETNVPLFQQTEVSEIIIK